MSYDIRFIYSELIGDYIQSLEERLSSANGLRVEKHLVTTADWPSVHLSSLLNQDTVVNVLFVAQEDLSCFSSKDLHSIPRVDSFNPHIPVNALFSLEEAIIPVIFTESFSVYYPGYSIEKARRTIVRLYRKKIGQGRNYRYFVGRSREIDDFEKLQYSHDSAYTNAVIVSGRPGVGREAFVRECIRRLSHDESYEPIMISMSDNANVELFLVQLNAIQHKYNDSELVDLLEKPVEEKTTAALLLINGLLEDEHYLIIDDERSCLRYNRKLSEWFGQIVHDPAFAKPLHLFVISPVVAAFSRMSWDRNVAYFNIYALSYTERIRLIYNRLQVENQSEGAKETIALSEKDVAYVADTLVYSPTQIVLAIRDFCEKSPNRRLIAECTDPYKEIGDKRVRPILQRFADKPEERDFLIFLSKLGYASSYLLHAVFHDEMVFLNDYLNDFATYGIIELTGELNEYIRVEGYLSDYIRRNNIGYQEAFYKETVEEELSKIIDSPLITEDYSQYLYSTKQKIKSRKWSDSAFLIPSVLVNVIIETYDNRDWNRVIDLCEEIIDRKPNYYSEVYREINYWYCLALAREKKKDAFDKAVYYIKGADRSFLEGFFQRNMRQYQIAEKNYRKALELNPGMQRAKRELVLVLQAQGHFSSALDLARENYSRDPDNSYHLNAYYRCLVRKKDLAFNEKEEIKTLLENAAPLFANQGGEFYDGMKFEYEMFVNKKDVTFMLTRALELEKKYPKSGYIREIVSEYRSRQGIDSRIFKMEYDDVLS